MTHCAYECPRRATTTHLCLFKAAFMPGPAPDEVTPADSDLAYDAMVTHLAEVHGITGPEAGHLVHNTRIVTLEATA